ncbi:MAG: hypothetical protein II263_05500, partial [Lachnospiraceae bacterium]|nr:hypothetical protein [Lachnospiraceae bacterium]
KQCLARVIVRPFVTATAVNDDGFTEWCMYNRAVRLTYVYKHKLGSAKTHKRSNNKRQPEPDSGGTKEEQVLFGISAKRKTRISELPMYFGQVMILVGLLLRVGFKGIPIHWMNEYTKDLIGYLTFFTATIPMYIYISKKEYASRLFETICGVLAVIQLITSMILFLLHAVNVCDVSKFLWLGAMFWGMFILLSLFRSIRLFWKKKKSTTVMTLFTCTYGGNERYTLRCVRSNQ